MRQNIFLIGFMGAGKSTVARMLRERFDMDLIEMDEQIERQEGMCISDIFAVHGEEYFRQLETGLLESLSQKENTVVSCGGGVAMRECNVEAMRKSGTIVYLSAEPETIYSRVKNSHNRPLLEGNMNTAYIAELLQKRLPHYLAAADVTVETDKKSGIAICDEIIGKCTGRL